MHQRDREAWGADDPWGQFAQGRTGPASRRRISPGACGARWLYFQDAFTLPLGNKHVAQPIRVTFEREQVGCWETGPAKRVWQLVSPNSQCALGNFPLCQTTPRSLLCTRGCIQGQERVDPGLLQPLAETSSLARSFPCVRVRASWEEGDRC